MKVAIGLRTCSSVFNYWNSTRIVEANKDQIILTCLNSLLKSIEQSGHECVLSIHDDNSSPLMLLEMEKLCSQSEVNTEFYMTEKEGNFASQYEWQTKQDCDFIYSVEDDYLHQASAIGDMVAAIKYVRQTHPGEYGIFPFNCPHRYEQGALNYPLNIIKGPNQYWRTAFHSTHTFFVSKRTFDAYDEIFKYQAYTWPRCNEDQTINNIWKEGLVKLICPMESLAVHLADDSQEEPYFDWKKLWKEMYYEGTDYGVAGIREDGSSRINNDRVEIQGA